MSEAPKVIYIHHADQIKIDGTKCLVFTSPAPVNFTKDQSKYHHDSTVAALQDKVARLEAALSAADKLKESVLTAVDYASDASEGYLWYVSKKDGKDALVRLDKENGADDLNRFNRALTVYSAALRAKALDTTTATCDNTREGE